MRGDEPSEENIPSIDAIKDFLPFRAYKKGFVENQFAIVMQAASPTGNLKSLCELGDVIRFEEVRTLIYDYLNFTDDILASRLCCDLNIIRVTVPANKALTKGFNDQFQIIASSIDDLRIAIPRADEAIRTTLINVPRHAFPWNVNRRRGLQQALQQLILHLDQVDRHLIKTQPTNRSAFWHDDAHYLAFALRLAAIGQGKRLGVTKPTSPAVKFIHAVLKRADVEHERPRRGTDGDACEAIASALKRLVRSEKLGIGSST